MVRIDMNLAMEFLGLIDGGQQGIISYVAFPEVTIFATSYP